MEDVAVTVRLSKAQDDELERLVQETGRTKSELIREAVNALIGVYSAKQAKVQ